MSFWLCDVSKPYLIALIVSETFKKHDFVIFRTISTTSLVAQHTACAFSLSLFPCTYNVDCQISCFPGITHTEIPSFLIGLIGIDNLPNGLSVAYLQQGIGSLVGIPIAGKCEKTIRHTYIVKRYKGNHCDIEDKIY